MFVGGLDRLGSAGRVGDLDDAKVIALLSEQVNDGFAFDVIIGVVLIAGKDGVADCEVFDGLGGG